MGRVGSDQVMMTQIDTIVMAARLYIGSELAACCHQAESFPEG